MKKNELYTLGIDIGSTTVKVAVLNEKHELLFSDYERHFADIQNTLASLLDKAYQKLGAISVHPVAKSFVLSSSVSLRAISAVISSATCIL